MRDGVTILDLSWGVAGPFATMLMADHGARVTRIERPGARDLNRSWRSAGSAPARRPPWLRSAVGQHGHRLPGHARHQRGIARTGN